VEGLLQLVHRIDVPPRPHRVAGTGIVGERSLFA
jgi:hypothetical protein